MSAQSDRAEWGVWADQTEPDRREIAADPRKPKITPHKTALFEVPINVFVPGG